MLGSVYVCLEQMFTSSPWRRSWSCWSFHSRLPPGDSWPNAAAAPPGKASWGPPDSHHPAAERSVLHTPVKPLQLYLRFFCTGRRLGSLQHVWVLSCHKSSEFKSRLYPNTHLRSCWSRCRRTGRSWWPATADRGPGAACPPSGPQPRCSPRGSRWPTQSSEPGSDSPVRPKRGNEQIQRPCRTTCRNVTVCSRRRLTWMVNGVSFFLLMVLSSMVSGTERLIILLTGEMEQI